MDKYIGNKKSILENIEDFMISKEIKRGVFFDAFTGTTNVAQYFKQRGYDIISNDINDFCYILQNTYIKNNKFPRYDILLKFLNNKENEITEESIDNLIKESVNKIKNNKIFNKDYLRKMNYIENIRPLAKVISYLNSYRPEIYSEDDLFFYNYYTIFGKNSQFISLRGTEGKRNYFNEYNGIKIGVILNKIKEWYELDLISDIEKDILLTALIEEVTLIANVNGTFHDFNRKKLYPNALVNMYLKPPMLNISDKNGNYNIFKEDANNLKNIEEFKTINNDITILYIDPPYNFRQYSSYYHMLNFIAKYLEIDNLKEYGANLEFVRGQNMKDDVKSDYCYKDLFPLVLEDLILSTKAKNILISYYDENNHWNHGKDEVTKKGREIILNIFKKNKGDIVQYDESPYEIKRQNYQSQGGGKKKEIDELLFYARKGD